MALSALSVLSARAADQFTLTATEVNVGGADYFGQTTLPPGFGDCLIVEASWAVTGAGAQIATAATPQKGSFLYIAAGAGTTADVIGAAEIFSCSATLVACRFQFDQPRFFAQGEVISVVAPDLESATTTGDFALYLLVRRLVTQ